MKFVYPAINHVFDTDCDRVLSIVIENQGLLYELLCDVKQQIEGKTGRSVVSIDGAIQPMDKTVELLYDYFPFILNKKSLLNKTATLLEKSILEGEHYQEGLELLSAVESFFLKASFSFSNNINFSKISVSSLIKACGLEFVEDYDSLGEKIIDYFELVSELEGNKLFILYNLRCVMSDSETRAFLHTVLTHGYNVVMLESAIHPLLALEQRFIVDVDLCEISD